MTRDEASLPLDDLARLTMLEPDEARAALTRRRCHAVLTHQRVAQVRTSARAEAMARAAAPSRLRPIVIGAFCLLCAAYVSELVATAARVLGR